MQNLEFPALFSQNKLSVLDYFAEVEARFVEGDFDTHDTEMVGFGLLYPDPVIAEAAMNAFSRDPYTERYKRQITSIFHNRYSDPERCIALIDAMEGIGQIGFLADEFLQLIKFGSPEIKVCVAKAVERYAREYKNLEQPLWDSVVLEALKSDDRDVRMCGFGALEFMPRKKKYVNIINAAITNFGDLEMAQAACKATRRGDARDFVVALDSAVMQNTSYYLSHSALQAADHFLRNPSSWSEASPHPDQILVHALSHPNDTVTLESCRIIEFQTMKTPFVDALICNAVDRNSSASRRASAFVGMFNADDPHPFQFALTVGIQDKDKSVQSYAVAMMYGQRPSFLGKIQDIIRLGLRSPFPEIVYRSLELAEVLMGACDPFILYPDIVSLKTHSSQSVSSLAEVLATRAVKLGESVVPTNPFADPGDAHRWEKVRLVFGIPQNGIDPERDTACDAARKLAVTFTDLSTGYQSGGNATVCALVFSDPRLQLIHGELIPVVVPRKMFNDICASEAAGIAEEYDLTRFVGQSSFQLI